MRKNSTPKFTQKSYEQGFTRTKYAEVIIMSERGEAKLTPAFDRAIAAAKKTIEDAAAARAAHATALAQHGQQRHVGRRNRPRGGGGN